MTPDGPCGALLAYARRSGDESGIGLRIVDDVGQTVGPEVAVSMATTGVPSLPSLDMRRGDLLAVWADDSSDWSIRGRLLDETGTPRRNSITGDESDFEVVTDRIGDPIDSSPHAAVGNDGSSLVVWDRLDSMLRQQVFARLIGARAQGSNPDGVRSGELRVSDTRFGHGATVVATDQGYLVVWSDRHGVRGRSVDRYGNAQGPSFAISERPGELANLAVSGERAMVAYVAFDRGHREVVRIRLVTTSGQALGHEQTISDGAAYFFEHPAVAATAQAFLVAWTDTSRHATSDSGWAVHARVIGTNGVPETAEFVVNAPGASTRQSPCAVGRADGRWLVVWTDRGELANNAATPSRLRGRLVPSVGL